ncbi:MAG: Ribokinase [Tenericutes bacterium ADurb.Bin239]|nr:MAG: Ribokinase [Tenericutes bacterium ADurb.Bin239]
MKKVFVLGSINYDLVIYTDRMPLLGESKCGHGMISNLGGKGANQAIAAKKIGVEDVYLMGAVGKDDSGRIMLKSIKEYGLDTSGIEKIEGATSGTCFIIFDESQKDNAVLVDKGANLLNNADKIAPFLKKHAQKGDIFITQLETNLNALYNAIDTAHKLGMYIIMNPSPVCEFDMNILAEVDLLVMNETEALLLSKIQFKNEKDLIKIHRKLKAKATIVTLGGDGAYLIENNEVTYQAAIPTNVVDTTCAGDTFTGALAYRQANGYEIKESLKFAATASSIAVSRKGAAQSIPNLHEVLDIYKEEK